MTNRTQGSDARVLIASPANLGPYHLARYNELVRHGLEVHIVCCPVREHFRPWELNKKEALFFVHSPFSRPEDPGVRRAAICTLTKIRPDVVIVIGYGSPFFRVFSSEARRGGIPTLLNLVGMRPRKPHRPVSIVKEIAKRTFCPRLFGGALVPGIKAHLYAERLGIPKDNIWRVGNVVDNGHFSSAASQRDHGFRSFLYVGRLAKEKNLVTLIEAFREYRLKGGKWKLRIAGDGPLRERLINEGSRDDSIQYLGWVPYGELPETLARASALILPSQHEPWGLVVNEAMAAGLPVLVSRRCGCHPELCREGINGLSFEPNNVTSISRALREISSVDAHDLRRLGEASREIVKNFSLSIWAQGIRAAVLSQRRAGEMTHRWELFRP